MFINFKGLLRSSQPVVVVTALVAVLGVAGTAYGAKLITGSDIKDGSVAVVDLSKGAHASLQGARGPAGTNGHLGRTGARGGAGVAGVNGVNGVERPGHAGPRRLRRCHGRGLARRRPGRLAGQPGLDRRDRRELDRRRPAGHDRPERRELDRRRPAGHHWPERRELDGRRPAGHHRPDRRQRDDRRCGMRHARRHGDVSLGAAGRIHVAPFLHQRRLTKLSE